MVSCGDGEGDWERAKLRGGEAASTEEAEEADTEGDADDDAMDGSGTAERRSSEKNSDPQEVRLGGGSLDRSTSPKTYSRRTAGLPSRPLETGAAPPTMMAGR
jgi:hypothetical protein